MGTHEAPRGRSLHAAPAPVPEPAPAPPVLAPVLPSVTTWDAPVGPAPVAPSGSSGLVPLRRGAGGPASSSSSAAPAVFVPGGGVTTSAATRLRWDEKGARRRASATTFGLTGRLVITGLVLLVVAVLSYGNPFGIPLFLAAAAWLLRDLWAKARTAPPRAPLPASPAPRAGALPAEPTTPPGS